MSLMDIQILIDVYPLKSKEDIAETLIYEVFQKFSGYRQGRIFGLLLLFKSGEHNEFFDEALELYSYLIASINLCGTISQLK